MTRGLDVWYPIVAITKKCKALNGICAANRYPTFRIYYIHIVRMSFVLADNGIGT